MSLAIFFILLQIFVTTYYLITIIIALGGIGAAISSFFYGLNRGKSQAEEYRIKPFREAAEGWEKRCDQLETEIKYHTQEISKLLNQYEATKQKYIDLVADYVTLSRVSQKQQGQIERLTPDVQAS